MCMYTTHPRGPSRVLWVLWSSTVSMLSRQGCSYHGAHRPLKGIAGPNHPTTLLIVSLARSVRNRARSRAGRVAAPPVVDVTGCRSWSLCRPHPMMERGDAGYGWYNGPRFALLRIHVPLGTLSGAELSSWLSGTCHAQRTP